MSDQACAEIVQGRDPDRYRAAMTAPAKARAALMALYAFNSEVFHAVWATYEPGLAEIRLQYWFDQVEALFADQPTDPHPVLDVMRAENLPTFVAKADLLGLIEARRWDAYKEPFVDEAALLAYLLATGGNLMAMAGRILSKTCDDNALRNYGTAAGLAAFLQAVPELKRRGRVPLPDESDKALRSLAQTALANMDAVKTMPEMAKALPTLLAASEARPVLKMVAVNPSRVIAGTLTRAPFQRNLRVLTCQFLRRF